WRKRECPPSEFFQNPWWPHSRPLWDYVGRLSAAMSAGRHVAPVALYYPTEHAWTAISAGAPKPYPDLPSYWPWPMSAAGPHPVYATDLAMQQIARALTAGQYDYDFVDRHVTAQARVADGQLRTAVESFRAVVVPPIDVIDVAVLHQLAAFAEQGGIVIFAHRMPTTALPCGGGPTQSKLSDGWTDAVDSLARLPRSGTVPFGRGHVGFVPFGEAGVLALLADHVPADVRVVSSPQARQLRTMDRDRGYFKETRLVPRRAALTYHRRRLTDGDAYLLVNESDLDLELAVELCGGPTAEIWDASTGHRAALEATAASTAGHVRIALALRPQESQIVVLGPTTALSAAPAVDGGLEHALTPEAWIVEIDDRTIEVGAELQTWDAWGDGQFSGIATYTTHFTVPAGTETSHRWMVDLGQVFETASISVNGMRQRPMCWSPYRWDVSDAIKSSDVEIRVEVANTNLNAFTGIERPSGLLGPVQLQGWRR
ncbi:MAG TPA: hypothetical protein VGN72_05290, partial [Tepidisphaeraceae bacterium]|nr:hypothetical protein [Tepidisphaeraceae bacterium]